MYFLSVALLLMAPAALPAACQGTTPACMNCCNLADMAPGAGSTATINCCRAFTSQDEFWMASPDSGRAAASSLAELAPPQIVHSFYEHLREVRNFAEINQPIIPQLDPLQKTTELLI